MTITIRQMTAIRSQPFRAHASLITPVLEATIGEDMAKVAKAEKGNTHHRSTKLCPEEVAKRDNRVVDMLAETPWCTVREIAEYIGIADTNARVVVDRLKEKGRIVEAKGEKSPGNGRRLRIFAVREAQ